MKRYAFHREAEGEYADEANYYARLDPELGGRFYDEIEQLRRDIRQPLDRFRLFDAPSVGTCQTSFPTRCFTLTSPSACSSSSACT